jgi:large subunit ribosomal protein L20
MSRVKRGTTSLKRRRNVLKMTKGYNFGRSTKERQAHEAIVHAGSYAFAHRRRKKGDFRRLWNVIVGGGAKSHGTSYSKLMGNIGTYGSTINRKMLAHLAEHNPETFERIVKKVS